MKILVQVCILALALSANAQSYVEAISDYESPTSAGNDGSIGYTFRANADLTVSELGVFAYIFDTVGPIDVALWSDSGIVASATVWNTNAVVNGTRYATLLSPVSLLGQQVYFIAAYIPQVVGINYVGPDFGGTNNFSPGISYLGYAYIAGSQLTKPTPVPGAETVVPGVANFRHVNVPVPEPGSLTLALLGVAAVAATRRNRVG